MEDNPLAQDLVEELHARDHATWAYEQTNQYAMLVTAGDRRLKIHDEADFMGSIDRYEWTELRRRRNGTWRTVRHGYDDEADELRARIRRVTDRARTGARTRRP